MNAVNTPRLPTPSALVSPPLASVSRLPSGASTAQALAKPEQSSSSGTQSLQQALADQRNWGELAQALFSLAKELPADADEQAVADALKARSMPRHLASGTATTVNLDAFISEQRLAQPTRRHYVVYLAEAVAQRALQSPLGNFGGGLSWPIPLSVADQSKIGTLVDKNTAGLPGLPLEDARKGALGYLLEQTPLSDAELRDPPNALAKLVASPRAQALGQAIQTELGGADTPGSVNDYVLAAINMGLDLDSMFVPHRNHVAGFDLASEQHWGKAPSDIVNRLSLHLVKEGRATHATARFAAHLLLARVAPQLLVKEIPAALTYGSQAWASFCIAAAAVEAQAPGTVANMTFAQVMQAAKGSGAVAPEGAQRGALVDWAVVNGMLPKRENDSYTADELDSARSAYNAQQSERLNASAQLNSELPSRKQIALQKLRETFGDNVPFEEKLLSIDDTSTPYEGPLYDPNRRPAGRYSLLDIAMMELRDYTWKTTDPRIPIAAVNAPLALGVNKAFNEQFKQTIDSHKQGLGTLVKQLVSQLPPADRQNLEHGKLEFFQQKTYELGLDFTSRTLHHTDQKLLIKATGADGVTVYEVDSKRGTINKVPESELTRRRERNANQEEKIEAFVPKSVAAGNFALKPADGTLAPATFTSSRTQSIGDAFVEHLDIDNAQVVKQAKGVTPLDKQNEVEWKLADFFLNLVPLRSAIVNFQNGNYADGATDLALDMFSFVTAGVGTAGKVAKAVKSSASTTVKAINTAKVIGAAAIGAFNPVSGAGDLLVGAARVTQAVGRTIAKGTRAVANTGVSLVTQGVNALRGATGAYDLVRANKGYATLSAGTFTLADRTVETTAVLHNNQWHAYDVARQQPYGPALADFKPAVPPTRDTPLHGFFDRIYNLLQPENAQGTVTRLTKEEHKNFTAKYNHGMRKENRAAFDQGFDYGNPSDIPGYSPNLNIPDLQRLLQYCFSPEDIGTLAKAIKQKAIAESFHRLAYFEKDIAAAGGHLHRMPQDFYLSLVNMGSEGECAGISNAMALAIGTGKEHTLLSNFYTAAANPNVPSNAAFISNIETLQKVTGTETLYHMGQTPRRVPYTTIISELANATESTTLRVASEHHALLAGVKVDGANKQWFYFDPNYGYVTFDSLDSMKNGLERTLNRGISPYRLDAYKRDSAVPEYQISQFSPTDLTPDRTGNVDVSSLSTAVL